MKKNLLPMIYASLLWFTTPLLAQEGGPSVLRASPLLSPSASAPKSSQVAISASTDFELIRLAQTMPSDVTPWELKDKPFIELVKFSASTAYRFSDAESLTTPLILFTFSINPDQKTYDFMPNLLEHKLLSDLLKSFYENLSSHITPVTPPAPTPETKRRRTRGCTDTEEREDSLKEYIFSQDEEEHLQYAAALKEVLSVHASPAILDVEKMRKSISLITKNKHNALIRGKIEKRKRDKRAQYQLMALSKSEDINFTMQFRNPRNKGTTTISVEILKNPPKDEGYYFPICQNSLETFINTTFFNLVMSKFHESMQDIAKIIQSAKTSTPKSLDYFI